MYRSFGTALDEFASTVDIADDDVLERVYKMLKTYLGKQLQFNFGEILLERWASGQGHPERVLDSREWWGGLPFVDVAVENGDKRQVHYCFVNDRPLWITDVNGGCLAGAQYMDSWSDRPLEGLPPYISGNDFAITTSIMQPLKNSQGVFGVINVESETHRICNPWAREELRRVAKGLATIITRVESHKETRVGTKKSIDQLDALTRSKRWNVLEKPKIFAAYGQEAKSDVVGVVRELGKQLNDHEWVLWQDHRRGREVRQRMLRSLRESRVVVCYLSEPASNNKYSDNANVLFEAGIAEGLASAWLDVELILIREEHGATPLPFDFRGLEVLSVPRDDAGRLRKKDLKAKLSELIKLASIGET